MNIKRCFNKLALNAQVLLCFFNLLFNASIQFKHLKFESILSPNSTKLSCSVSFSSLPSVILFNVAALFCTNIWLFAVIDKKISSVSKKDESLPISRIDDIIWKQLSTCQGTNSATGRLLDCTIVRLDNSATLHEVREIGLFIRYSKFWVSHAWT